MGPPQGAQPPGESHTQASSEAKHSSGRDSLDQSRHTTSKRSGQHEDYHKHETKRRKAGSQQAAKIQEKATQLVQQLAVPDGPRAPYESQGTLAKAEHRQDAYNQSIESKPWAGSREHSRHSANPTAGLPMQTGHYVERHSPEHQSGPASFNDTDKAGVLDQSTSRAEHTDSDPSAHSASVEASQSESDSESPAIEACKQFSSTHKFKRHSHGGRDSAAVRDRQLDEQTYQNHQQNDPEDEKRYVVLCPA